MTERDSNTTKKTIEELEAELAEVNVKLEENRKFRSQLAAARESLMAVLHPRLPGENNDA